MKIYICDLCKKEITPADIRVSFPVEIDDKIKELSDMHSHCYYKFMAYARKNLIENEEI